jgi:creatinine amidohydrolase
VRVVDLAADPWPAVPEGCLVLVPIGSTEQHGPHLPFTTDAMIASAACRAAAPAIAEASGTPVVIAPAQALGASGEHQAFPGTISIGHEALGLLLVELVRSLSTWADRILLVNGHGGNVATMRSTVARMRDEGHRVSWIGCAVETPVDAHAGRDETSVMMHLFPGSVLAEQARPGAVEGLDLLLPRLMAEGVRPVSPNGVLGDPRGATPEEGARLFAEIVMLVTAAGCDA